MTDGELPPRYQERGKDPIPTTSVQHGTASSRQSNQKKKRHQIRKEEEKLSLFVGDVTSCVENLMIPQQNLVRVTNSSGLEDTKATHTSVAFLYTANEQSRRKLAIPLTIVSERMKHLGISLTKEVKDLYSESHTHRRKELKT